MRNRLMLSMMTGPQLRQIGVNLFLMKRGNKKLKQMKIFLYCFYHYEEKLALKKLNFRYEKFKL